MKALLYTSDPYEPSGVIGLFETEEQKQAIIQGYIKTLRNDCRWEMDWHKWQTATPEEKAADHQLRIKHEVGALQEIEIPVGVYGQYY